MPTTVTLLLFSGRRDPTWELTAGEAGALAARLAGVVSAPELSTLGYRGFLVESDEPELPRRIVVRAAPELERFLLETGRRYLDAPVLAAVESMIG